MANKSSKVQHFPPEAYPQMVTRAQAAKMAQVLRSSVTAAAASQVIEESGEALRGAVKAYASELEDAGGDFVLLSDKAHEIRGMAETAGMPCTGRIADGLCRYFDDAEQSGVLPDASVVALHVSAIVRTAHDPDATNQTNHVVAHELATLAGRKLAESRKAAIQALIKR